MDESQLIYVDVETTGLRPGLHVPWEIALITAERQYRWLIQLTPGQLMDADPVALEVGGFHDRHPQGNRFDRSAVPLGGTIEAEDPRSVAGAIGRLTHGKHLVGACVWFDEQMIRVLCQRAAVSFEPHYHLIDVESLALGHLYGYDQGRDDGPGPSSDLTIPWKSSDLWRAIGVDPEKFERHTALGDAYLARAIYRHVAGGPAS